MKQWYVLYTGYENSLVTMKRMVKHVLPRGCGVYVPVTITGHKDRPTRLHNKSVYPFYLFVCCNDISQVGLIEKQLSTMMIDGYFLTDCNGELATVSSDEIREIEMRHKTEEQQILREKDGFSAGTRVRVIGGPMEGFEGSVAFITNDYVYVSLITKKKRVTIEVPMLYTDLEIL